MKIKICEFRARNIATNPMATIEVEKKDGKYYYVAFDGSVSVEYRTLSEAKIDIADSYKNWIDFKMLI